AEERVNAFKRDAEGLHKSQQEIRAYIREKCGLSPENIAPVLLEVERERFNLEIEGKLKEARRQGLARMIAEQTDRTKQRTKDDQTGEYLETILAAREALLETQRNNVKTAAGTTIDVEKAEADLAEARLRAAQHNQEIGKSRESIAIDQLNQQLVDLSA